MANQTDPITQFLLFPFELAKDATSGLKVAGQDKLITPADVFYIAAQIAYISVFQTGYYLMSKVTKQTINEWGL
jgi:hypothetical protein